MSAKNKIDLEICFTHTHTQNYTYTYIHTLAPHANIILRELFRLANFTNYIISRERILRITFCRENV